MNQIVFTKVSLPYGWMSNMSAYKVEYNGIVFPTAEHLFQWGRIKDEFANIKAKIVSLKNPIEAKQYIKREIENNPLILKHQMLSQVDVQWMFDVVTLKFRQHEDLLKMLIDTGNLPIYEDVTNRCNPQSSAMFWGAAECLRGDKNIQPFWVGNNHLGKVLQHVRGFIGMEIYAQNKK